ncbi:DNA N-6-adenine-methyltransferase [Bittarella massiliensis (ex Durand et al. 2017)]|uniref:DNA N-6-adenine-methyltransferase n=1 Tax=Bittarella massiliensis (ex Durand et al. 2017) TaxID=1720313 RepID=UPI00073F0FE8|nr:DNA N-6-adenine-methyltransferase [Bittarella massiliensis (ex Durand et al. 2017)]
MNRALLSSKTVEWETPQDFFDQLDAKFHFSIDVAANENNRKCPRYYTKEQDGLAQSWAGETVWCNPPYGREIGKWVEKAYIESQDGGATVVMLIPSRTDTKWFHTWIYNRAEVRFLCGRLKFGGAKNGAPFPSMVVVFRAAIERGRRK